MSSAPCLENFVLSQLRDPVLTGKTRSENWRRLQMKRFEELLESHENQILMALSKDLEKPPSEALFEVIALRQELKTTARNLKNWMRPRKVQVPISLKPGEAMVKPEPLGCVLIIGPWNYPFSLTLQPLISALAAGNTAVLKPSEQAPNTSKLIASIVPKYFPTDVVRVFEGDSKTAINLLQYPFDHIFFTGGGKIGQKVMTEAAKNLTPVTLELGGQSPAIVLEGADLEVTARRLIWGKPLLKAMKEACLAFYGKNPVKSTHLARIINKRHFSRLNELLQGALQRKQVLFGGEVDNQNLRISPTLIEINDPNDPIMQEEIFGPLLPVIDVPDLASALSNVRGQPRPLALYFFGGTKQQQRTVLDTTSSGGVCFNDVIMQAGIPEMPFGGVGASGIGTYHGLAGFETFSHFKSVLKRPFWLDIELRYPPYKANIGLLKKLLN